MERELYEALGLHLQFGEGEGKSFVDAEVNGRSALDMANHLNPPGDVHYHPCAEAFPGDEAPRGEIRRADGWTQSKVFPNTIRSFSAYLPATMNASEPPALLVCFDGDGYLDPNGPVRAAAVLDSLIHQGAIPPTMAVFVNPGMPDSVDPADLAAASAGMNEAMVAVTTQRGFEYDSIDDRNAIFVIDELLPAAEELAGIKASSDPARRVACGISSGAIAAFTMAWHHPDSIGRVLSHCGSYVNLRGGHNYPYLIRTTPRKPVRIYLQSGEHDANLPFGNWPLANQQMASALEYAGYEHRFMFGSGGHSLRHGGALFADALRYLLPGEQ